MKRGTLIKIIRSQPAPGQESIENIIGKVYPVRSFDRETRRVTIEAPELCRGLIVIQPEEYQIEA